MDHNPLFEHYTIQVNPQNSDESRSESLTFLNNLFTRQEFFDLCYLVLLNNSDYDNKFKRWVSVIIKNGFRYVFENNSPDDLPAEFYDKHKEVLVNILRNNDIEVCKILINSCDEFIGHAILCWPELYQLVIDFGNSGDITLVLKSIYIIIISGEKFPPSFFEDNSGLINGIFDRSLDVGDLEMKKLSCQMIATSVRCCDGESLSIYQGSFNKLLTLFFNMFSDASLQAIYGPIMDSVCVTVCNVESLINPLEFTSKIFSLAESEGFPTDFLNSLLLPLEGIIEYYSQDLSSNTEEITRKIFRFAALAYQPVEYAENTVLSSIVDLSYSISQKLSQNVYSNTVINIIKEVTESPSESTIVSILGIIYVTSDPIRQHIVERMNFFVNSIIRFLGVDSYPVREACLLCLVEISKFFNASMNDIGTVLIGTLNVIFDLQEEGFYQHIVVIVNNILSECQIKLNLYRILAEKFLLLVRTSREYIYFVVEAFSSMIYSAKGEIYEMASSILDLIKRVFYINNEISADKCVSLEALTNMFVYVPEVRNQEIGTLIDFLNKFSGVDDNFFRSTLVTCFYKLVEIRAEFLIQLSDIIYKVIQYVFAELSLFIVDFKDMVQDNQAISLYCSTLTLISKIIESYHELIPNNFLEWAGYIQASLSIPVSQIQEDACKASVIFIEYMIQTKCEDPSHFYESLIQLLNTNEPLKVICVYDVFATLTNKSISVPENTVILLLSNGFQLLTHTHPCQADKIDLDEDEKWNNRCDQIIINFFITFLSRNPNSDIVIKLVELCSIMQKIDENIRCLYCSVLDTIYKLGKQNLINLTPIIRGIIINYGISCAELCNFTNPASPILLLVTLITYDESESSSEIILSTLIDLIGLEMPEEKYYPDTIYASLEYLLIYQSKNQDFDYIEIYPIIFNYLPVKSIFDSCNNIYKYIINFVVEKQITEFYEPLVRVLILVFSKRDIEFSMQNLSEEVFMMIKRFLLNMLSGDQSKITEVLEGDQFAISRVLQRLT